MEIVLLAECVVRNAEANLQWLVRHLSHPSMVGAASSPADGLQQQVVHDILSLIPNCTGVGDRLLWMRCLEKKYK